MPNHPAPVRILLLVKMNIFEPSGLISMLSFYSGIEAVSFEAFSWGN
jgi:hypothetical protein